MVEPLLWRPLGWCRLELDVAGQRSHDRNEGNAQTLDALLPVGPRAEAGRLLDLVLPGARPVARRPPARARWKSPVRFHNLAAGWTPDYLVTGSGRLNRLTDIVPLAKVQSLRLVEGPISRALSLATVHVDTAGRSVHAALVDRDGDEARRALAQLADLCRAARVEQGVLGAAPK